MMALFRQTDWANFVYTHVRDAQYSSRALDGGKILLGSMYFVVRPKQNANAEINGSMGSDAIVGRLYWRNPRVLYLQCDEWDWRERVLSQHRYIIMLGFDCFVTAGRHFVNLPI